MPDHVDETLDGATIDFWTGPDAMRWTPEPPPEEAPPPRYGPAVAFHHTGRGTTSWTIRAWTEELLPQIRRSFNTLHDALTDAGLLPEPPPVDPRERALWAARHRGTGPARTPAGKARRPRRHQP